MSFSNKRTDSLVDFNNLFRRVASKRAGVFCLSVGLTTSVGIFVKTKMFIYLSKKVGQFCNAVGGPFEGSRRYLSL